MRRACLLVLGALLPAASGNPQTQLSQTVRDGAAFLEKNRAAPGVVELASGLQYMVLKTGAPAGTSPGPKDVCSCHYVGRLIDGTVFDSSAARGRPSSFKPAEVVAGWAEALQLMRPGDKWRLTMPHQLGYGRNGGGGGKIPGGAVLVFSLELLAWRPPSWGDWLTIPSGLLAVFAFVQAYVFVRGDGRAAASGGGFGAALAGKRVVPIAEAFAAKGNARVWFDVSIGGAPAGRIRFVLFSSTTPKTAENFRALCTGEKGCVGGGGAEEGEEGEEEEGAAGGGQRPRRRGKGLRLHFKGSAFHRVVPGFMLQGGDFERGDGTGGASIYGALFADEWDNGAVLHAAPGLLSMANKGKDSNGSQFFITTAEPAHLDGRHVVFGSVADRESLKVVKAIEACGSAGSGRTSKPVVITDCDEAEAG